MVTQQPPPYLVALFAVTAGQNGENLGSDEEQIVFFVYLLYDVPNNKVVALHHHYVKPAEDDITETVLTEECKIQTGLNEELIKSAQPLDQVLDEFERFITQKEIHPEHGGKPFVFITDGQLHFRMCLNPESSRKNICLPLHYYKFFDLRKEFKKLYKVEVVNCIKDMLDFLPLEGVDQSVEYGIRHCQDMANIVQRLINDGHQFTDPEIIKDRLEPGICSKNDIVDDETVVRSRGLPWQSSDQDIARFFKGLNVAKGGVALCLSQQGRRNGEALVRFETKEHRDLALRKHKHHLGQRYIEVYRATGKDFVNVAGGSNTEAQVFLSRHSDDGNQVIVRMRGLPYSCSAEQVLDFFREGESCAEVLDGEDGILFVHQADGRATGDAFVLFSGDEEATKALSKHRQCIGTRYIELFKSTTAEVQQVLNRSMDPRTPSTAEPIDVQLPALIPQLPPSQIPGMLLPQLPQQIITSGTKRDCIRMRGLPFEASVTDILTFLAEHSRHIVYQGVHMVYNAQGTPSGEAFIQMNSEQTAEVSALAKHKKFMFMNNKKRYIEVIQCSGEDMNLVLTNGLAAGLPPTPMLPQPGVPSGMLQHRTIVAPGMGLGRAAMLPPPPMTPSAVAISTPSPVIQGAQASMVAAAAAGVLPTNPGFQHQPPGIYATMAQMGALPQQAAQQAVMATVPTAAAQTLAPPMAAIPGLTHLPPRQMGAYGGYQPLLYWYPSPPVSPQSATYYMQPPTQPTTVMMKGLPYTSQAADVMNFLDGICEVEKQ